MSINIPPKSLIDLNRPFALIGCSEDGERYGMFIQGDKAELRKSINSARKVFPELFKTLDN